VDMGAYDIPAYEWGGAAVMGHTNGCKHTRRSGASYQRVEFHKGLRPEVRSRAVVARGQLRKSLRPRRSLPVACTS
jgi:hypothetical protein